MVIAVKQNDKRQQNNEDKEIKQTMKIDIYKTTLQIEI